MTSTRTSRPRGGGRHSRKLSPLQQADCDAFAKLRHELNAQRLAAGQERITFLWLEKRTGVSEATWGNYARGERAMKVEHQSVLAEVLQFRPQDRFPGYPHKTLVMVAPDERIPWMVEALSKLLEPERAEVVSLCRLLLRATRRKRHRMALALRGIGGENEDIPPTPVKKGKDGKSSVA